jgi:hypothetical protein
MTDTNDMPALLNPDISKEVTAAEFDQKRNDFVRLAKAISEFVNDDLGDETVFDTIHGLGMVMADRIIADCDSGKEGVDNYVKCVSRFVQFCVDTIWQWQEESKH